MQRARIVLTPLTIPLPAPGVPSPQAKVLALKEATPAFAPAIVRRLSLACQRYRTA